MADDAPPPFCWPILPNWRDAVTVNYAYKTEVIASRDGHEQRRSLRQTPRVTVEFTASTWGSRFRAAELAMQRGLGPIILMPDAVNGERVRSVDNGVFTVAGGPYTWTALGKMVAIGDRAGVEAGKVAAVTHDDAGTHVRLTGLTGTYAAGVKLFPTWSGRLGASIETKHVIQGVMEAPITFNVDPGSFTLDDLGDPDAVFLQRELFFAKHNWVSGRTVTVSRDVQFVDYEFGPVTAFTPTAFCPDLRVDNYVAMNKAEATRLLNFFQRQRGQRGGFYCASDQPDMQLVAVTDDKTHFVVQGSDVCAVFKDDPTRKAISVIYRKPDGSRERHAYKLNLVEIAGADTRLAVDEVIKDYPVEVISWLPMVRMGSDEATFTWTTDQTCTVTFSYQTLIQSLGTIIG